MKRALVTGSAGFAGRHYVRALQDRKFDVTGIDIVKGDDARDYFRRERDTFDLVIHCAAIVGGRAVIEGTPLAQAVNLELDSGLFQWAERTKPGRVVYISSSAVYPVSMQGDGMHFALAEDDVDLACPELPDQLYGWAKLTGEILAARYSGNVTVIRPFSGYGEDQDVTYPFRAFAERAKRRDDPFVIWGTGTQVRDFIHIDDVVAGTLALTDAGVAGPVNLGTGVPTSMTDLAVLMCDAMGYQPAFEIQRGQPKGVQYRVGDVTRMHDFYVPLVSVEEGVSRAVAA
jgi:UDP-glucose 4-epimerase